MPGTIFSFLLLGTFLPTLVRRDPFHFLHLGAALHLLDWTLRDPCITEQSQLDLTFNSGEFCFSTGPNHRGGLEHGRESISSAPGLGSSQLPGNCSILSYILMLSMKRAKRKMCGRYRQCRGGRGELHVGWGNQDGFWEEATVSGKGCPPPPRLFLLLSNHLSVDK